MAERRGRFSSVRVRTTLAATVVVGVAVALGALVLVTALRSALREEVEEAAERRAEELVATLERGAVPVVDGADDDEELVLLVGPGGDVLAASEHARSIREVVSGEDGSTAAVVVDGERQRFRIVVEQADTADGEVQVFVGRTLEDAEEATAALGGYLAVGAPPLIALVGLVTWWVVGRALRPVDRIREEVDGITVAELARRVPEPASRDEIGRLAETMNRMLARLEEGQERQRRFVADASHELRSPVASLRQHAEVGTAELRDVVLAESERMHHLIDDLLLLARADEGSMRIARRPVDLDDLAFQEVRRLRVGTGLQVDGHGVGAGRVDGDAGALRRVLRNLGDNAARHATSTVSIGVRTADGTVALHVDDDGPGVPEAERSRVLERFVRLDEARARDAGGAGLGLAIVREVVEAHGGSVVVGVAPLGGARVTVTLPQSTDP